MKKRLMFSVLAVMFALALSLNAAAILKIGSVNKPSLTFSGSTATCSLSVRESGESINVTLELWQGSTKIATWTKSGNSYVFVSGSHSVTSGKTYTVKAYGTIGGTAFTATAVSKTSP